MLTDDENGFSNEENSILFLLGFDDGDLELLSEFYDFGFGEIKEEYMRILRLPVAQGGFGINDVTYDNLINNDNYLIPNHPDIRRHVIAKRTIDSLSRRSSGSGGMRRTNKGKTNRRMSKRKTNRRMSKRKTNRRRTKRRMNKKR